MPLPRIQPIAPTWRREPFDDPEWVFEMKYDGYRALCYVEPRRNRLISRNNNIMNRFDALCDHCFTAAPICGQQRASLCWLTGPSETELVVKS